MTKLIKLIKRGNRDERCYTNGHTWSSEIPYFWDSRNGMFKVCEVCEREEVDVTDRDKPWFDTSLLNDEG